MAKMTPDQLAEFVTNMQLMDRRKKRRPGELFSDEEMKAIRTLKGESVTLPPIVEDLGEDLPLFRHLKKKQLAGKGQFSMGRERPGVRTSAPLPRDLSGVSPVSDFDLMGEPDRAMLAKAERATYTREDLLRAWAKDEVDPETFAQEMEKFDRQAMMRDTAVEGLPYKKWGPLSKMDPKEYAEKVKLMNLTKGFTYPGMSGDDPAVLVHGWVKSQEKQLAPKLGAISKLRIAISKAERGGQSPFLDPRALELVGLKGTEGIPQIKELLGKEHARITSRMKMGLDALTRVHTGVGSLETVNDVRSLSPALFESYGKQVRYHHSQNVKVLEELMASPKVDKGRLRLAQQAVAAGNEALHELEYGSVGKGFSLWQKVGLQMSLVNPRNEKINREQLSQQLEHVEHQLAKMKGEGRRYKPRLSDLEDVELRGKDPDFYSTSEPVEEPKGRLVDEWKAERRGDYVFHENLEFDRRQADKALKLKNVFGKKVVNPTDEVADGPKVLAMLKGDYYKKQARVEEMLEKIRLNPGLLSGDAVRGPEQALLLKGAADKEGLLARLAGARQAEKVAILSTVKNPKIKEMLAILFRVGKSAL